MTDFPLGRWHGQWIWAADTAIRVGDGADVLRPGLDPRRFDRRVLFRRTFELDAVPATALFRVSADSRYVLYVNARELARGPIRHGLRRLHYDFGDAAPALRPGRNVVAVLARFYGYPMPWWEPTPPTFTLGGGSLVAELKLGDDSWIVTDGSWACHEPDAWTPGTPHTAVSPQIPEVLDARRLDPRWTTTEFNDREWGRARVLPAVSVGAYGDPRPPSEPFGALLPRPFPPPTEVLRPARSLTIAPVGDVEPGDGDVYTTVSAHLAAAGEEAGALLPVELDLDRGPVLVVADFGTVVSGHLRLEMHAPAGVRVAGALVETVAGAGTDLASAAAFGYTTRGADDTLELGDPAGGRYAVMALRGPGTPRSRTGHCTGSGRCTTCTATRVTVR